MRAGLERKKQLATQIHSFFTTLSSLFTPLTVTHPTSTGTRRTVASAAGSPALSQRIQWVQGHQREWPSEGMCTESQHAVQQRTLKFERGSRSMPSASARVASGPRKPIARSTRSASRISLLSGTSTRFGRPPFSDGSHRTCTHPHSTSASHCTINWTCHVTCLPAQHRQDTERLQAFTNWIRSQSGGPGEMTLISDRLSEQ